MLTYIENNPIRTAIFAIFALVAICYSHTLYVPFVFDDSWYFEQYDYFRSFNWIFQSKYWINFNFRSVNLLSFTLNYKLHALWLPGYHIVGIALHALNGVILFLFVKRLWQLQDKQPAELWLFPASVAAALFICHPIQTQAVIYTIQRGVLLSSLFYLLAMHSYLSVRKADTPMVKRCLFILATLLCYYLSLFSKQTGATIIISIFLIEILLISRNNLKKIIIPSIIFIGLSIILAFILLNITNKQFSDVHRWYYLMTQAKAWLLYFKLILLPFGQSIDHLLPLSHAIDGIEAWGFVLFFALIGLILIFWRKAPIFAFGIAWFIVTMQVESGVFPIEDTMVEHRLYLPMIGLSISAAWVFAFIYQYSKKTIQVVFLVTIIGLTGITIYRASIWRSSAELWLSAWKSNPQNIRALNNAGYGFIREGKYEEARRYLSIAVLQSPDTQEPLANLAYVYYKLGDTTQIKMCINQIAVNYGLNYYSRCVRALYYAKLGKIELADQELQDCISEKPSYYLAYNYLGDVYYEAKQYPKALHWYTLALRNHRGDPELQNTVAAVKALCK